jgi:uncharacterized protein YodC (DUF2158 family)
MSARGTTVRLVSGGPLMTVREVNGDTITCDWFDKQGRLRKADFFANQLKEGRDQGAEDVAAALLKCAGSSSAGER